jgi:hypothetical protein
MESQKRKIDDVARNVHSWWWEAYVYAKEKKIKSYKALLIVAFFAGSVAAVIWLISYNF